MKFVADFRKFMKHEVDLNASRIAKLEKRVEAVSNYIAEDQSFSDLFLDVIPSGSWAYGTIIKPVQESDEYDADVLLYLKEKEEWLPKDYVENLYSAFQRNETYKGKAHRMTRCVRVDYAGDFHLDVVPYIARSGQTYITNRHEPENVGRWELSYPERFTEWIDLRQRCTKQNFSKVVRLLKYLRDHKDTFTCKSLIFLTLLGERITEDDLFQTDDLFPDLPTALVCITTRLAEWLPEAMPSVIDPAGSGDNFSERYRDEWDYANFRSRVCDYAIKIRAAYDEQDLSTSTRLWRAIFGENFKPDYVLKEFSQRASSISQDTSTSIPAPGENFIDQHPFNFNIKLDPHVIARVYGKCIGYVSRHGVRKNGFRQYELSKNGNWVAKDRKLRFELKTNVLGDFNVYWKVRNGGQEAFTRSALRGEITQDGGNLQKEETTSYHGSHYVECYVVKGSTVVAQDRQNVIVGP